MLSREQELAICADLIGQFAGVLESPRATPVPTSFDSLWDELRGAVDGAGDVSRAIVPTMGQEHPVLLEIFTGAGIGTWIGG